MSNHMQKHRFKVRKAGPRQFYWVLLTPGNQIAFRGPAPGKYLQSKAAAKERIANVKNGAHAWLIDD